MRGPKDVETYVRTPYKINTVAQNPKIIGKLPYENLRKLTVSSGQPPPSPPPSPTLLPLDPYHGPATAATSIAASTTAAPTNIDATPIAATTDFTSDEITKINVMIDEFIAHQRQTTDEVIARFRRDRKSFAARLRQDCDTIKDQTYDECVDDDEYDNKYDDDGPFDERLKNGNPFNDEDGNPFDNDNGKTHSTMGTTIHCPTLSTTKMESHPTTMIQQPTE